MKRIAPLLRIGTPETLRQRMRRAEIDAGACDGVSSAESRAFAPAEAEER